MIINKYDFYTDGLNLPETCPICGADLEVQENGQVRCVNPSCEQKVAHKIEKFLDKLGVKGAGPSYVTSAAKDCKNLYDYLSTVTKSDVESIRWAGGVNGTKVAERVNKALGKEISIAKFISVFDIEAVSEGQIEKVTKAFPELTLNDFLNPKNSEMFLCDGIKETLAEKIYQGLLESAKEIENCIQFFKIYDPKVSGVIQPIPVQTEKSQKLSGLSFCFTGKAEAVGSRNQCESLVLENGGTISSVKRCLSYLVTDDTESGSSKNKKAKELGIPVITSFEFKKMIED